MRKDFIYSLELIYSAVENLLSKKGSYDRLRPFLPYCLYDIEGHIIPMNRDYKPIGLLDQDYVEYECFHFLEIPNNLIDFTDLCLEKDGLNPKTRAWWFFSDSNTPKNATDRKSYQKRVYKSLFSKYSQDRKWHHDDR